MRYLIGTTKKRPERRFLFEAWRRRSLCREDAEAHRKIGRADGQGRRTRSVSRLSPWAILCSPHKSKGRSVRSGARTRQCLPGRHQGACQRLARERIETLEIQLKAEVQELLSSLRDTLLTRLISGQLRLPEAEAAVATAL